MAKFSHVLITGTTSGLGRSFLAHFSELGCRVTSVNRRSVPELEESYPKARFHILDVQDSEGIQGFVSKFPPAELPDLVILNAGVNAVDNDEFFDADEFSKTIQINLFGVLNFVSPLTKLAGLQKKVTVVAISSMTNYLPNPYCVGYYAGKYALTKTFEVLEEMYAPTLLDFKHVILGPVPTGILSIGGKLSKAGTFLRDVFSVPDSRAVKAIAYFASSNRRCLVYPLHAALFFKAVRVAQNFLPGFYRGRKTLKGKKRGSV